MAITTYAELQAAAANWLVRADLTSRIPEFIALAEARLNRVLRARLAEADASLVAVPASRSIALPAAYTEPVRLWFVIDGQRCEKKFCEAGLMNAGTDAAEPDYWGVDGANIVFERPCNQAYSVVLRCLSAYALSDVVTTNSLLTAAPDIYLFATLAEAGPFLRDPELTNSYEAKLGRAINELNSKDRRSKSKQTLGTEVSQLVGRMSRSFDILRGQ